jgi:hypothetical protein
MTVQKDAIGKRNKARRRKKRKALKVLRIENLRTDLIK